MLVFQPNQKDSSMDGVRVLQPLTSACSESRSGRVRAGGEVSHGARSVTTAHCDKTTLTVLRSNDDR